MDDRSVSLLSIPRGPGMRPGTEGPRIALCPTAFRSETADDVSRNADLGLSWIPVVSRGGTKFVNPKSSARLH